MSVVYEAILPLIMGGSALATMIINHQQQRQAEHAAQNSANAQMAFQANQTSTSYQRGVEDMKKAGLNPALAYTQGGANSAAGASANAPPPVPTDLTKIATSAADSMRLDQAQKGLESQTALNAAQGMAATAQARVSDSTALKNAIETEAMRKELPARSSEAIFRKKKADLDARAAEYDAVVNRLGQATGIAADATSVGRLIKNLRGKRNTTPALPPREPGVFRGKTLHRDGDPMGTTVNGRRYNKRTGEIYD